MIAMEWLALILFGLYLLIGFVVRTAVHVRRTGDSGFRGLSGRPGSTEWWAGVLFAAAVVAGLLGPLAGLAGLGNLPPLDRAAFQWAGVVAAALGIVGTFLTQVAMGNSWRVGVRESERTELVTDGLFAVVRNPFFTATLLTGAGIALVVPNVVALLGWALLLAAVELQVRVVEEPYLRRHHGDAYGAYLARVGRFVPRVGLSARQPETVVGSEGR
jgi:protein-S-isoprenylcysteine O-methyltransferase Ste14